MAAPGRPDNAGGSDATRFHSGLIVLGLLAVSACASSLSAGAAAASTSGTGRRTVQWKPEDYASLAVSLGVRPPAQGWPRSWRLRFGRWSRRLIVLLQQFDPIRPRNSSLSLLCMWWKAMAANDATSPVHDDRLQYDLLPRYCRWIVSPQCVALWPRLVQTNIEIRMAYLRLALADILADVRATNSPSRGAPPAFVQIVMLGGGYDVRSVKLLNAGIVQRAVELDLPDVVDCKRQLLTKRLAHRCRAFPELYAVDLNELDAVERVLEHRVFQLSPDGNSNSNSNSHDNIITIFLFEGVMLYLGEGIPTRLLAMCSRYGQSMNRKAYVCFADRLEMADDKETTAAQLLESCGWTLKGFRPKPGATRHMGWAVAAKQAAA